jgi:hypothetical protein
MTIPSTPGATINLTPTPTCPSKQSQGMRVPVAPSGRQIKLSASAMMVSESTRIKLSASAMMVSESTRVLHKYCA